MNSIYNNPQEWLKKPLIDRLEELRKINCTGPCGQSNSTFCKRTCEDTTIKEAIEILKIRNKQPTVDIYIDEERNDTNIEFYINPEKTFSISIDHHGNIDWAYLWGEHRDCGHGTIGEKK